MDEKVFWTVFIVQSTWSQFMGKLGAVCEVAEPSAVLYISFLCYHCCTLFLKVIDSAVQLHQWFMLPAVLYIAVSYVIYSDVQYICVFRYLQCCIPVLCNLKCCISVYYVK